MKRSKKVRKSEPLRIAAYVRVSTLRQAAEGDSLEAQQNDITKYIEHKKTLHGWLVKSVEFYVDAGRSAKDQKRPELQRLKRDIAENRIDVVLCFKLDRITRSLLDFVDLWDLFEKHEVQAISLREDFDTSTPMGQAVLKLIMVFAELERNLTAERTIATMRDRVERGLHNGGLKYGYVSDPKEPGRLIVDPEWAPIIQNDFFNAFEDLGSVGAVLRRLDSKGIRTPERQSRSGQVIGGKRFKKNQVVRILRNSIYIGRVKWGEVWTDNAHEAIISAAQFDRVQRKLDENTQHRRNHRYTRGRCYLLRSLIRCSCGAVMTPKGAIGRNGKYHYYTCTRQGHEGVKTECSAPAIPAEALERAVMDRVVALGSQDQDREKIVREALRSIDEDVRSIGSEADGVRHRLTTVQTEIQNLVGVLKRVGEAGLVSVQEEIKKLEVERGQLRERLVQLANQEAPLAASVLMAQKFAKTWQSVGELLRQATPDEQRIILQHYIEAVELKFDDQEGKVGRYVLKLFPEVQPLDQPPPENRNGPSTGGGGEGQLLTDLGSVRQSDKRAPRLGLEPRTQRLTAACSTD